MPLFGPLAMIGLQVGAGLVSSFIASKMNKKGSSQKGLEGSIAAKNRAETDLINKRLEFLNKAAGFTDRVSQTIIDPKTGKPLVIRLPGVGGISSDEFSSLLDRMVGATDFGGMRELNLLKELTQLASGGSNSAGAAAGLAGSQEASRQAGISGTSRFINDAIGGVINGLGPSGGDAPLIGPGTPVPPQSPGIEPLPVPGLEFDANPLIDAAVAQQIEGGF